MTDELDTLRAALKSTPPAPDRDRKAADLAAAMTAFDEEISRSPQGSTLAERPIPNRSIWARLANGGFSMIDGLTSKAGLAATTGLVTAGVAVMLVLPQIEMSGPPDFTMKEVGGPRTTEFGSASDNGATGDNPKIRTKVESLSEEPDLDDATSQGALPQFRRSDMVTGVVAGSPAGNAPVAEFSERQLFDLAEPPMEAMRASPTIEPIIIPETANSERFANADENPVKVVKSDPVSTFSVDVDTASYAVVRSALLQGHLPDPDSVRIEEMVNYFPYAYDAPEPGGTPFLPTISVAQTPWNPGTRIVHIGLQGVLPPIEDRPPLNLVFLIDTSGSMHDQNKLPLLQQSLRLMIGQLRPEDQVAIVTYAGSAGQVLEPTPASEQQKILSALDRLQSGGSTAGHAGLEQAYALADSMSDEGDVSRVLLATDGDFNVGISDPDDLKAYVERKRDSGTFLSVFGFGRGNLNDTLMQALAQNGNGQAAYIDTIAEAQKVLVDQLTGTLFPIAKDVKIQVEFNPASIAEYRLIGYETRALRREDFNNDAIDAGEIGAGHQVTALYEVTPVGSDAILSDPLRYQPEPAATDTSDELGFLRLRYKAPDADDSQLIELPISADVSEAGSETRFATAIAGFGQLLREGDYIGDWAYADAIRLANDARGEDLYGYRAEAVRLMRLAESLSD